MEHISYILDTMDYMEHIWKYNSYMEYIWKNIDIILDYDIGLILYRVQIRADCQAPKSLAIKETSHKPDRRSVYSRRT